MLYREAMLNLLNIFSLKRSPLLSQFHMLLFFVLLFHVRHFHVQHFQRPRVEPRLLPCITLDDQAVSLLRK